MGERGKMSTSSRVHVNDQEWHRKGASVVKARLFPFHCVSKTDMRSFVVVHTYRAPKRDRKSVV